MSAKIRRRLFQEELIDPSLGEITHIFICGGTGIVLTFSKYQKGAINFTGITEDDDYWSQGLDFNLNIVELQEVTKEVIAWCNRKCIKSDYGWLYTSGTRPMKFIKTKGGGLRYDKSNI